MQPPSCRPANRVEILIGRSLAVCVHPVAAWQRGSRRMRAQVVIGYFAASYAIVLSALEMLS
jgi:hypothetical protein